MANQPQVHGNCHMTASGHLLATQAGYEIFEMGGNAIDAGVAAGLALGVVHSDMVQFAGVAPIMVYLAEQRQVVTISGLGGWPAAASIDHFIDDYHGTIPEGVLRTVVPAAPDAWIRALELYGTFSFAEIATPAIRLAEQGFPMHTVMRDYIAANVTSYRRWAQNAAIYLPDNQIPEIGAPFVQTDLAATMQHLADEERAARTKGDRTAGLRAARDAFYRGDLAHAMAEFHRDNGGWLTLEDLANFESAIEPAIKTTFQGVDVYTCGPWCQGPVLQQSLALLAREDLRAAQHNSAEYIHLITEATKLAFADRERYYGDPRFVDVPMEALLAEDYNQKRRALINPQRAHPGTPEPGPVAGFLDPAMRSQPPAMRSATGAAGASADTSFVCTVDATGNLFSATPSDVSWEAPIIPGTGICPSTRGSQSWAVRGHASSVAPGKRPRLTPNPALAIVPGKYAMPFGTPGGDNQTQAMLQVLLNHHIFGMPIQDAIEAPRFMSHSFANSFEPHACYPGKLTVEGRVSEKTTSALEALGHDVERLEDMAYKTAGVCAIVRDEPSGLLEGGADPRRMSRALGR